MKPAIAYIRVSTSKQEKSGLSLEDQSHTLAEFAKRNDYEVVAELREVESGTKSEAERPSLLAALEMCKTLDATLIIVRLDRLYRSSYLTSRLQQSNVKFVCCDMPQASEMTINIMAAIAQNTAENIRANTRAGIRQIKRVIKRDGFYVAKSGRTITALGNLQSLTSEGRAKGREVAMANLMSNPERVKVKKIIKSLYDAGKGCSNIAASLNDIGMKTVRGNEFDFRSVKRLIGEIKNESNTKA